MEIIGSIRNGPLVESNSLSDYIRRLLQPRREMPAPWPRWPGLGHPVSLAVVESQTGRMEPGSRPHLKSRRHLSGRFLQ